MTKEEFERLLTPLLSQAVGLGLRLTGNRDDAMDLVQETTLKAFSYRETFVLGTHFKAWYFKILMNQFFRNGRKKGLEMVQLEDGQDAVIYQYALSHDAIPEGDPATELLASVDRESVQAALSDLPDDYREVCMLYFITELAYDEIAEALEIPIGTVRSRLHRGRKLLQAQLWSIAQERGLIKERI